MANQTKRGRRAELATRRTRTDASDASVERAVAQPETSLIAPTAPGAATSGADFAHAALGHADLADTNLSHAVFEHADLAGANLAKANLSGATLRFATASVADFEAADLSGADLQLACFNHANLSATNLRGAILDHANLRGANLAKANLSGASLRFANLEAATLGAADLSGADLRHARLDRADLSFANLSGALLDYADFFGANLANANLCGARLRYAKNLTPTQLEQGRVSDATILPFHPQEGACQPWERGRSNSTNRSVLIAGLLLAALAAMGLVWHLLERGDTAMQASLVVAAATPVAASPSTVAPPPEPLAATASARVAAAAPKDLSLSPRVFAPDLRVETPEASPLVAAAPRVLAALQPIPVAPNLSVASSEAASVVARTLPAARAGGGELLTPLGGIVPAAEVSPPRLALSTPVPLVLSDAQPPVVQAAAATLTLAVRELGNEEQPSGGVAKTATPPGPEPLTLVVSLREQKLDVYRGTGLVISSKVSSGKRGYDTKAGVFSILEKQRYHHSNLFSGAPMPWMQRLTWSGTALHAGVVPGYPASHGCVRLPFSFAPKLFQMTTLGENVVVTGDRVAPKLIKNRNLFQPAPRVAQANLAFAGQNELVTGIFPPAAAAENPEQAASNVEPTLDAASAAPLRILVTRRTERDQIIDTQYLLASLGYLTPQNFSGRLGNETQTAIKAFQKANGLRETGAFSDDLARKVYQSAGKPEPPAGHLFVRQDFRNVLDAPIAFLDPERSLGTYVFTVLGFAPESGEARWIATSLEGGDPAKVLDRIQIPNDLRQEIAGRLTPGSSLIVADTSVNSAILSEGDDFVVLAKVTPATAALEPRTTIRSPSTKPSRSRPRPHRLRLL